MHRLSLGSSGNVDLHPTIEVGELGSACAVVGLESLRLTNLISRDSEREGTISFSINGQETLLSWAANRSGKLKNRHKFHNQILFLGKHEELLDLSVAVVESAEDVARRLSRIRSGLGLAASLASLIPGPGSLAAGGLGLAGALVATLQKQEMDDVELLFRGSIGDFGTPGPLLPLKRSGYGIRRNSDRGNDILLVFKVMPYQPVEQDKEVVVLLDSIEFELHRLRRELVFEATLGSGRNRMRTGFEAPLKNGNIVLDSVFGIQNQLLYRDPWKWGIPFHFNLTTLTQRDAKALRDVVSEAGDLTRQIVGSSQARALTSGVTKAVQSLRSMVIEFLPEKESIGLLHGHLCAPESMDRLTAEEQQIFVPIELLDSWQEFSLPLETERVGKARINLRIKQAPE